MSGFEVISPGLLTSIQDGGRQGHEHLGISPGGAADSVSLLLANRLVGNSAFEAALEMTLVGPTLRFACEAVIALAGADFGAEADGRRLLTHRTHKIAAGQVLKLGTGKQGCRGYLAIQNGMDVPCFLGSKSGHLQSGVGGRALKAGDRISLVSDGQKIPLREIRPQILTDLTARARLRVTDSIHSELFSRAAIESFYAQTFTVTEKANRLGVRLQGGEILKDVPDIQTTGVCLGGIQISPDGQPTLLFVEGQLTGGYPLIANVIGCDLFKIGQLRPGDRIKFEKVPLKEAIRLLKDQNTLLNSDEIFL